MNFSYLFQTSLLFAIILDPLGNVPIYLGVLRDFPPKQQQKIVIRELLIALGIMVLFFFFGTGFFRLLGIDQPSLQVAGGAILFLIGIRMIFAAPKEEKQRGVPKDPLIVPLAVPAVAGPGILATISIYGGVSGYGLETLLSIMIAWACLLPPLLAAPWLKHVLGDRGLIAAERLFGFIVILVSTQMCINGLASVFSHG